jgi:predicted acyl esterase
MELTSAELTARSEQHQIVDRATGDRSIDRAESAVTRTLRANRNTSGAWIHSATWPRCSTDSRAILKRCANARGGRVHSLKKITFDSGFSKRALDLGRRS